MYEYSFSRSDFLLATLRQKRFRYLFRIQYYRLQKISEGSIDLEPGRQEAISGPTSVGTGVVEGEKNRAFQINRYLGTNASGPNSNRTSSSTRSVKTPWLIPTSVRHVRKLLKRRNRHAPDQGHPQRFFRYTGYSLSTLPSEPPQAGTSRNGIPARLPFGAPPWFQVFREALSRSLLCSSQWPEHKA